MSGVRFPPSPQQQGQHDDNQRVAFFVLELRQEFQPLAPNIEALNRQKYPHKKAKLVKGNPRWYIYFGVYDCITQKIKRKRYYKGINEIEEIDKRLRFANSLVAEINSGIAYWATNKPVQEEIETFVKPEKLHIIEAIEFIIQLKYNDFIDLRKTSHTFASNARKFIEFCKEKGFFNMDVKQLQKHHVQNYIDDMVVRKKLSGQTVENRISTMRAIYNHMIKRNIVDENPFAKDLDKPKIIKTKKNHAYSAEQIQEIKQYAEIHNPGIWIICQFIYYTYMRPVEIGRLKVADIILEEDKIFIPASISKNATEAHIFMPPALKNLMVDYLSGAPKKTYFLFSKGFKPGQKQAGYNYYGNNHRKITRLLNFEDYYTLYSWKHTGVVNAYKAGVDIKSIQMQLRHSSIEQSDTYLKSLGFGKNENFRTGIPSI